jgi:hypothetical protein
VYLKIFAAIAEGGYDVAGVLTAYTRLFPDERPALERIVQAVFGTPRSPANELWLLNAGATIGTSLFDQFRALPRPAAFDLNAASLSDLTAVDGVDLDLAERIMRSGPFTDVADVRRVHGISEPLAARFIEMRRAMLAPPAPGTASEGGLSIHAILMPYVRRAAIVWLLCAALGAALYRAVRRVSWLRAGLNGAAAAALALVVGWMAGGGVFLVSLVAPVVLFGAPGAVIRAVRSRSAAEAARVVAAWTLAACAAAVAVTPIG